MAKSLFVVAAVLVGVQTVRLVRQLGVLAYEVAGALMFLTACVLAAIESKPELEHPALAYIPLGLLLLGVLLTLAGRRSRKVG